VRTGYSDCKYDDNDDDDDDDDDSVFFMWHDNPKVHTLCKHPLDRRCSPSNVTFTSTVKFHEMCRLLRRSHRKQLAFCLFIVYLTTLIKN
jgi:hypothetical protein